MKTFRYQCVQIGHIRNGLILVQASFNSFIIWCFCCCFVLDCSGFIFWFCFCCCWFLGVLFGYSKSYFSVNSNKDIITDTVVYVSFSFFLFFFCQTIKLQNIAKVCCVYTSTYQFSEDLWPFVREFNTCSLNIRGFPPSSCTYTQ